ncbi:hypothetical protein BH24BAC1_BH24BAC1_33160 [soil metagenome]
MWNLKFYKFMQPRPFFRNCILPTLPLQGFLLFLFCFLIFPLLSFAQITLTGWEIHGNNSSQMPLLSTGTDTRMQPTLLERGNVRASGLGDSFVADDWSLGTRQDAIANGKFLQFKVTPKDNFTYSLSSLNAVVRRSDTGPTRYQYAYSLDNFATPGILIDVERVFNTAPTNGRPDPPINLTGIADLQNLPSTATVTFRAYAWGSVQVGGSFGFFSRTDNALDLAIGGRVSAEQTFRYSWAPQGSLSASWAVAENWSPPRLNPSPADALFFDQGGTTVATNVPTEAVARLAVENGTDITLVPDGSSTLTLLDGKPEAELAVQQNSTLQFRGEAANASLTVYLPAGSTGLVGGTIVFTGTNVSGINHRLLAEQAGAIQFLGGSTFLAERFFGNPFGNTGAPNTVVFNPGAQYIARSGGNPFGLAQPASKVVFARQSIYRLEQAGAASFAGRTYGDLIVDLSRVTTTRVINANLGTSSQNPLTVDNFTILDGAVNFPLNANNLPQNVNLLGSLTVGPNGALNYSPQAASAASVFSFVGDTSPVITGQGTITFGQHATLRLSTPLNQLGVARIPVTLNRSLVLAGTLDLQQGVLLIPSLNHVLTIGPGGTVLGGNANSFVQGNLARSVPANTPSSLFFPLGFQDALTGETAYRPVTLQSTASQPTTFIARQVEGPPADRSIPGEEDGEPTLENVSQIRHFTMVKVEAESVVTEGAITLSFGAEDRVTDPGNLRIASSNVSAWMDLGGTVGPGANPYLGSITAPLPENSPFGDFVLANAVGGQNPLPVELTSFTATAESGAVTLRWSTASETNNRGFEIQRSTTGTEWSKVNFMKGYGNSQTIQTYRYTDRSAPTADVLYYRLKQLDQAGTYAYSKILAVSPGAPSPGIALYPNPVVDELRLHFPHHAHSIRLRVMNLLGQVVLDKSYTTGESILRENLSSLPAGTYYLEVWQDQGRTTRKFVKASR